MRRARLALAALLALCASGLAWAAPPATPPKPIRLVVPFPAGAGTDAIARFVAHRLSERLGTPIVVDNRAGAGGAIGAVEVARSEPDGSTLLFIASPFTTVAASSRSAGYELRQFAPVAAIAVGPLAFVVHPDVPAATMREFVAYAKSRPGVLNYGSAGPGSINHLALELLRLRTGADIVHVPYKGIAPATTDLLAGQIQSMTASIPATLPFAAQHKVKVLAVTGARRIAAMPGVPTWREQGIDATVVNYWGIAAPADVPEAVVQRLNHAVNAVLAESEVRERLTREGTDVVGGPPERLRELLREDYGRWKRLVAEAGLKLD